MSTENGGRHEYTTREYARAQDHADELSHFRAKFYIPTKADLKRSTLFEADDEPFSEPSIYLCGNSLGLQPRSTATFIDNFLAQWRTKGVLSHFVEHKDSQLEPFLHIDDHAARLMAPIVGAQVSEVAMMGTLTGNLHLLMSAFYRPAQKGLGRYKVLLEGKAFPSDHFAIESQITLHGLDPADAMVLLEPDDPSSSLLTTSQILSAIDKDASDLALILLPGIQFYTGQFFDMKTITAHAHSHGIMIGWDCAHAVGNIDLKLHDWDVDFAAWCSYKYLNSGPGAMAGIFVHEKHGQVDMAKKEGRYIPRLTGWWGDDKSGRFKMTNEFVPRPGAAGFQLSNPSALDLSAVVASLTIFNEASMAALRAKSLRLTEYLQRLLEAMQFNTDSRPFGIISPVEPEARGAQLSLRLQPGLLESVLVHLETNGVILDERKPDVIRVAPAPLYNSFEDVWKFCEIFKAALSHAQNGVPQAGDHEGLPIDKVADRDGVEAL